MIAFILQHTSSIATALAAEKKSIQARARTAGEMDSGLELAIMKLKIRADWA